MRMNVKIKKAVFVIGTVFFLLINTGCVQNISISLDDITVAKTNVSRMKKLTFKYSTEPADTSKIYVELSVYKQDVNSNVYNIVDYNPFTYSFEKYMNQNKDYIEEDSIQMPEDKGILGLNYIGKKAVSGNESIIFEITDTGKYAVNISIFSNDTKYLPSKAVNEYKLFEVEK